MIFKSAGEFTVMGRRVTNAKGPESPSASGLDTAIRLAKYLRGITLLAYGKEKDIKDRNGGVCGETIGGDVAGYLKKNHAEKSVAKGRKI